MDNGWIKLHRKLLENPIFDSEKGLKIWIWCTLKANHKDNFVIFGRKKLLVKKGQFIMGGIKAEEVLKIARTTIYYWIDFLQKEGMIDIKKTNKYTIITIQNWDKYQDVDIKKTSNVTTSGQQVDTNNKGENERMKETTIADKNPPLPVKEIKKTNDDVPMNLEEFREWTRSSPQRHIQVIGEWAGAEELTYTTKAQWTVLIKRNLRPAKELISYSEDQLQNAYTKMLKDVKHKDKNTGKEVGFLSKYTLETLVKYI